jgi:hypothetical protein
MSQSPKAATVSVQASASDEPQAEVPSSRGRSLWQERGVRAVKTTMATKRMERLGKEAFDQKWCALGMYSGGAEVAYPNNM